MEMIETFDMNTLDKEGKPVSVVDYKLFYPEDFEQISEPKLVFDTDKDYIQRSFEIISGSIYTDLQTLQIRRMQQSDIEHGIVQVNNSGNFYKTREILTGKNGIGFYLHNSLFVNDYLHTHSINEGENQMTVNLFSASDLMSLGSKGAERYWLVGQDLAWCLVNLYGTRNYHYIKSATTELANKEAASLPFSTAFSQLIDCVNKCEYRLYRSNDLENFDLVNI